MVENSDSEPTPLQLYEIIRGKYTHEDLWVQQRVGWLLSANGFLFAGYGALFGLYSGGRGDNVAVAWNGLQLISCVGAGLALLAGLGVFGAHFAKEGAKKEWSNLVSPEIRQRFPKIDADADYKGLGSSSSGVLCAVLFIVWLCISLIGLSW